MDAKPRHIHKTLLENFDFCDRYAYLKNYWNPPHPPELGGTLHGVTKASDDPARVVGAAIHNGVNAIALGASENGGVEAGVSAYEKEVKDYDINSSRLISEHRLLIEASVRIWAAVQLPIIKANYRVVEAEQSIFVPLTPALTAITRPDIVLQNLQTGRFVNYSLKTERTHRWDKHPNALIDIGGTLESASLAYKLGGLDKVEGTWMTYLVVGDTHGKQDKEEGTVIWHPGIRGWSRPGPAGETYWAWKWKYDNPAYDPYGPKSSRLNPETKSLSGKDGWRRFRADQIPGGVEGWVKLLVSGKLEPAGVDPVPELVHSPEPYSRNPGEVESFLVETVTKQSQVNEGLAAVAAGGDVDIHFPKRRSSCMRYGRCEMWDICWRGAGADPWGHGYTPRKSSLDKAKEKGLVIDES